MSQPTTYQCNNTFYKGEFNYNLGEIISEEDYGKVPTRYQKWFTKVGTPPHFYCQNLCGDENFSIDEWNAAFDEAKNMSNDIQRMILDQPPACSEQCFACMAIVGECRSKNAQLTGVPDEDSPQRKWYKEWKAAGKPPIRQN